MTELSDLLMWATTAGAGVLAYFLMDEIAALIVLGPKLKRFVSFAMTGIIALAAWGLQILMAYAEAPVGWRSWIEAIVSIVAAAIVVAQGVHGLRDLPNQRY